MNVRRLQLDVDKAVARPDLLYLTEAIDDVDGVEAVNVTVTKHRGGVQARPNGLMGGGRDVGQ